MRISVVERFPERPPRRLPCVLLQRDNWDDYSFRTMYWAEMWSSTGRRVELGSVKILRLNMGSSGRVGLTGSFERLSDDLCSLGQATSYYEALAALGDPDTTDFLDSMRDAAASPQIYARFSVEEGFGTSLLRDGSARQALDLGKELFAGQASEVERGQLIFDFDLAVSQDSLHFDFGRTPSLPSRIFAVTGYNGVGKTRLLSSLGMIAASDDDQRSSHRYVDAYGAFVGDAPDFGAVLCVSYSAFDDFPVPHGTLDAGTVIADQDLPEAGASGLDGERDEELQLSRAYHYIGLRRSSEEGQIGTDLKSIGEIATEFEGARQQALNKLRQGQLDEILKPLLHEPSFARAGGLPDIDADGQTWNAAVARLSTGHKIVLNIIVQMCAKLERRSLVLFDEPEMHLHPPLVAALLSSVQVALEVNDSFAVVSTHSPVVVQELPGRNVLLLRRAGNAARIEEPEIETFGEHIGLLTSRVFNLDNSASDFRGVLIGLAASRSLEEIEDLFALGLSSQARVIVQSEIRQRKGER